MKQLALYLVTPFARLYKTWDTWYTKRQLEKRWVVEYEAELAKLDGKEYPWYPVLVKNQRDHIRSSQMPGYVTAGADSFTIFRIGCAAVRKLTTLSEIVGFQPMVGPVGTVYNLAFKPSPDQPEGKNTNMKLEVVSRAIQAGTRKLTASWTCEVAQDLQSSHDIDFEKELTEVVAYEIAHEIIEEVLKDLRTLAQQNDSFIKVMNGRTAAVEINALCNDVARTTRRGPGNFVIGSPMFVTMLQIDTRSAFVPTKDIDYIAGLSLVGVLNGTIKVYCSMIPGNDVIIGYKGESSHIDAGYIFSPYVPLMSSGVVINPVTFQPAVSLMTRYGKWYPENTDTVKVFAPGSTYYRTVKEPTAESVLESPYDPTCVTEDYIFPHPSGRGSKVEVLPGGAELDAHGYTDLEYFQNKLLDNLQLPEGTNPEVDHKSNLPDTDSNAHSAS